MLGTQIYRSIRDGYNGEGAQASGVGGVLLSIRIVSGLYGNWVEPDKRRSAFTAPAPPGTGQDTMTLPRRPWGTRSQPEGRGRAEVS